MLKESVIENAKNFDLPEYIRTQNLNLVSMNGGSAFKINCPFHEDKTPSLNMTRKSGKWLWNCFGCGSGGSPIDFIMKLENLDFRQAVVKMTGGQYSRMNQTPRQINMFKTEEPSEPISLETRARLLSRLSDHYHKVLLSDLEKLPESTLQSGEIPGLLYGLHYLSKRGLLDAELIRTFKIGYCDGKTLETPLKEDRYLYRDLGIFSDNYYERYNRCVSFPVMDKQGNVTDLYGRRTWDKGVGHLYNNGSHVGLWNASGVLDSETVILTESIIDALSVYKAGFKNVTAIYGTNGFIKAHEDLLSSDHVKTIVLALDNDKSGQSSSLKIAEQFKQKTIVHALYPEGIKDMNQLLVEQGAEAVKTALQQAVAFTEKESLPEEGTVQNDAEVHTESVPEPVPEPKAQGTFEFRGNDLYFTSEVLCYVARDVAIVKNLKSLKLVLSAELKEGSRKHTDKVDLVLSRSRRGFETAVAKRFDIQPAIVEEDLIRLLDFIEADFMNREKKESQGKRGVEVSPEDRAEAIRFLKDRHLIRNILEHISILGYVGEDMNKLLLYLCATSRKLKKPLSALIRSQSSTGKSFLIKTIASCIPAEDLIYLTSASDQAIYYMEDLRHKFIAIDEQAGVENLEYVIRSLQSEGRVSRAVTIKDMATGQMVTVYITKDGPVSYVDGSTNPHGNPENRNRNYEAYLDESAAQTAMIQALQRKAHTLEGWKVQMQCEAIKKLQQNMQRLLKPVKVIIPFADKLNFPTHWLRTRRDHARFLSLIECIAFLHQYQREEKTFNGETYIEATLSDYTLAFKMASEILFNTFQEMEKPVFDFYQKLEAMVKDIAFKSSIKADQVTFTQRRVREHISLENYLIQRFLKQLSDLEYLNVKKGPNGSRFIYSLNGRIRKEEILKGLTTPSELKVIFNMTEGA